MIQFELVTRIAEQGSYLYAKGVDAILDTISISMARGDRVELRGFGVFEVRQQPGRAGRNPRN